MNKIISIKTFSLYICLVAVSIWANPAKAAIKEWKGQWQIEGKTFPYIISVNNTKNKAPVVIYLKSLSGPRLGTDTDESIVKDMLTEGYMVVQLDCHQLPAESPQKELLLTNLNQEIASYFSKAIGDEAVADLQQVYFVPSGYRIARDQVFWNIEEYGAPGTLDYIVQTYNNYIVKRRKLKPIQDPSELRGPKGNKLDYNLRMDIIYPSGSVKGGVPIVVNYATQSLRISMFSAKKKGAERMVYPIGFLLSGYAWANVDHAYNPLARHENFGHINEIYTLDNWNALASATASIRFLRSKQDTYNLNGKIGAMGISKASYSVTRLADTQNAKLKEYRTFRAAEEKPQPEQPWKGFASTIDVAYTSAGHGIRRLEYMNDNTVPIVTSAGQFDKFKMWDLFPTVTSTMAKKQLNFLGLWMEDLGHTYPVNRDFSTGFGRYELTKKFFDQHLHPFGKTNLEVLFILPSNGHQDVQADGMTKAFPDQASLPADMKGIPLYNPITVRFARSVDPSFISTTTVLITEKGKAKGIQGEWHPSFRNTRFQFIPTAPLKAGKTYTITLSDSITDTEGNRISPFPVYEFTVKK